jgi:hypothetical protein
MRPNAPANSAGMPWGLIDNRPYLRCLHGKGLCLWRLGRVQEAAAVFHKQYGSKFVSKRCMSGRET